MLAACFTLLLLPLRPLTRLLPVPNPLDRPLLGS